MAKVNLALLPAGAALFSPVSARGDGGRQRLRCWAVLFLVPVCSGATATSHLLQSAGGLFVGTPKRELLLKALQEQISSS